MESTNQGDLGDILFRMDLLPSAAYAQTPEYLSGFEEGLRENLSLSAEERDKYHAIIEARRKDLQSREYVIKAK